MLDRPEFHDPDIKFGNSNERLAYYKMILDKEPSLIMVWYHEAFPALDMQFSLRHPTISGAGPTTSGCQRRQDEHAEDHINNFLGDDQLHLRGASQRGSGK
jgi:hypothetical protein